MLQKKKYSNSLKILPVFKSGDKTMLVNFELISNLSSFSQKFKKTGAYKSS